MAGFTRKLKPSLLRNWRARCATAKKPAPAEVGVEEEAGTEEEEVEMDESLDDDDTFIEEQEEEDADVTDIIGGDIENKEEG